MYLDKEKILSSIHNDEVIKICTELGHPEYKMDSQGHLCFNTCLCHGGDSPNKLVYYDNAEEPDRKCGYFHCFTCGDSYNVIELVLRAKRNQGLNVSWSKSLYFVAKTTGNIKYIDNEKEHTEVKAVDTSWMDKILQLKNKKDKSIPKLKVFNEVVLELFCYIPHEAWLNENISRSAMNVFSISYYSLTDQIIIPHYDKDNNLIGIRGRFMSEEDQKEHGKYMPLTIEGKSYAHSLGSNLYGLNIVRGKINSCKKIMLVEAEKSCLQCYSYYGEDSFTVATCGSSITTTQIKLILSELSVEEVIYAPDRDYVEPDSWEASIWYNKQILKLAPLVPFVKCCLLADNQHRLEYKDSPTDRGKEILEELLDEKIIVTMEEVKKAQEERKK